MPGIEKKKNKKSKQTESDKLIALAHLLSQQKAIDDSFKIVAQKTAQFLNTEIILILMINPKTHQTLKTIIKQGDVSTEPRYRFIQNQVSGWILKNNQSLLSPDINKDERFHELCFDDQAICSVMGVPLKIEDAAIGTLIVLNSEQKEQFLTEDLSCLEKIGLLAAPYLYNIEKLQQYFMTPLPASKLISKYKKFGLIGKSKKFIDLLNDMDAATRCDVRVLLEGQSGTGKELIARAIHLCSERKKGPFVAIDCGAIPANLLESELFGHVKGAFTGATVERKGLIEEAHNGTLFMDEIINLPIEMQSKLMRVLQENEIRPVGSNRTRKVDVRIITAASKPLEQALREGLFREDLYYRLYVYPVTVPNLTDRQDDIPLLANYFLKKFTSQQQKKAELFHADVLQLMKMHSWAGNIRELENFVERLVTLSSPEMKVLDATLIPPNIKKKMTKSKPTENYTVNQSLAERVSEFEEKIIREALIANDWNQSRAARALKISVQALRYKISRLG
ncbi:MAG: sigma-54-dependent Fis family transcriptional regulator, partial [bacterium]